MRVRTAGIRTSDDMRQVSTAGKTKMPASAGTAVGDSAGKQHGRSKMLRDCAKSLKRSQSAFGYRKHRLELQRSQLTERRRADSLALHDLTAYQTRTLSPGRRRRVVDHDRRCARMCRGAEHDRPGGARHRSLSSGQSRSFRCRVSRAARFERTGIACRPAACHVGRCLRDEGRVRRSPQRGDVESSKRMRVGNRAPRRQRMGDEHRKRWPRKISMTRASFASCHP